MEKCVTFSKEASLMNLLSDSFGGGPCADKWLNLLLYSTYPAKAWKYPISN